MSPRYGHCWLELDEEIQVAAVRIETAGLDEFQQQLLAKQYKYSRPDIEDTTWGTREMTIADPFGNALSFVGI